MAANGALSSVKSFFTSSVKSAKGLKASSNGAKAPKRGWEKQGDKFVKSDGFHNKVLRNPGKMTAAGVGTAAVGAYTFETMTGGFNGK